MSRPATAGDILTSDRVATRAATEWARLLRVEAAARALVDTAWHDGVREMSPRDLAHLIGDLWRALEETPDA